MGETRNLTVALLCELELKKLDKEMSRGREHRNPLNQSNSKEGEKTPQKISGRNSAQVLQKRMCTCVTRDCSAKEPGRWRLSLLALVADCVQPLQRHLFPFHGQTRANSVSGIRPTGLRADSHASPVLAQELRPSPEAVAESAGGSAAAGESGLGLLRGRGRSRPERAAAGAGAAGSSDSPPERVHSIWGAGEVADTFTLRLVCSLETVLQIPLCAFLVRRSTVAPPVSP